MNTDGFFVVNMRKQVLQAHVVNDSDGTLTDVRVYVESLSDPGIALTPVVVHLGDVPAGASVAARFIADFTLATPGAPLVSFVVEANGFEFRRLIKKIFVTKVEYDQATKTYSVVMPQGTMRVNIHKAIMGPQRTCNKRDPFVVLPRDLTYDWIPNPPYEGIRGPFPYEDPWWKIAVAILAGLLALGGLLYDYLSDDSLDGGSVSVSGTFDEVEGDVACCTSIETSASEGEDDWIAKGLYAAAGVAASVAIKSDGPDLHFRGQEATPPGLGELTTSERVRLLIEYPVPPSLGVNYPIHGKWGYVRTTTARTYDFGATDDRNNLHFLSNYEVKFPETHDRRKGSLPICARFVKPDGEFYRGNELYVSAVLVSTYGVARRFELHDDGRLPDKEQNDGWYCGGYLFRRRAGHNEQHHEEDKPGHWYLFVFAQDVNTVTSGVAPFDAAHTIGGLVLTNQLRLAFNEPCQLNHDGVISVT